MGKWEVVTRLPGQHEPRALWFQGGVGLVLGYYQSVEKLLELKLLKARAVEEAIILRAKGDYASWTKVYSGTGEMLAVTSPAPGMLFALGVIYDEQGNRRSFLVSSTDQGQSWAPMPDPPIAAIGVAFDKPKTGYAWSEEQVYQTEDGGQTWHDVEAPPRFLDGAPSPLLDSRGTLWAVGGGQLHSLDRTKHTSTPLPESFQAEVLALDPNGKLWLAGNGKTVEGKRGPLELWAWHPGAGFQQVAKRSELLPEHLHVGRTAILLIASDVEETPPDRKLHLSTDGGKSWKQETPAVSRGISAVFFEGDGTIWMSASQDRLLRRRP